MRDGWPGFGRRGESGRNRRPPTCAWVEPLEARDLLALLVGPVVAAEGVAFQGRVATFAGGDVPAVVSTDYHATINWGDGSPADNATIQFAGGNTFEVLGAHTYGTGGLYTLSVALSGSSGSPVTSTGPASVSASTLSVAGQAISAEAGLPFSGVVAVAVDSNPSLGPADFTAAIDWGDGTTSAGTLAFKPGGGGFNVVGTHTYAQAGTANAHVTVTRTATGQFATATAAATVSPPASSLTGSGATIVPLGGVPFQNVVVATFHSTPPAPQGSFQATIDWGDGQTSAGTITPAAGGNLQVLGSHVYPPPAGANAELRNITVTVVQTTPVAASTTIASKALVQNPLLAPIGSGTTITPTLGVPFQNVVVASFQPITPGQLGDFSATINWGDGQTSAGTVMAAGGGLFRVVGSHAYVQGTTPQNPVPIKVTVIQTAGAASAAATFNSKAEVQAPLAAPVGSVATITPVAGVPFRDVVVATFRAITPAQAGDFVATINWGDGQTSAGRVVAAGGGLFRVLGSHTYGTAGPKTIAVKVVQASGGDSVPATFTGQAVVQERSFTGRLDPLSDTGLSNHDGVTRLNQLKFSGTARPYSLVQLESRLPGQLGPVLLGQAAAGGDGSWAIFVGPLLDGRYTITATVTPPDGSPLVTAALPPVTIDTVAPQVTLVQPAPRAGTIVVGFRDDRSGMDLVTLYDRRNYNLVGPPPHRPGSVRHPSAVAVAVLPTNPRAALATLHTGPSRFRFRSLQVLAGGVADLAGNPLKGGNFVARLR